MKNSWPVKKLGDICKTGSGGTPMKAKKEFYDNGTIPWLLSGEVSQGEVWSATNFITQKGLENSSARIFPKDTVLVAMYGATAGEVGILRFEAATNQAVCGILPNKHFVPEFLFYFLLSKKDELVAQAAGNAQPNISQIKIKNTYVPIVPLSEQQRIVGILDEAFDGIATAKTNAERNLQNARALFDSYLHTAFTQRGEGWQEKKLGEVAESISTGPFGTMLHKSDYVQNGIPLVNPMNIVDSQIVPSNRMMVSEETRERLSAYTLKAGDIVIARRGELGRCALVTDKEAGWLCGTGSFFVRLSDFMDGQFFVALFSSKQFRTHLENSAVGTTMSNLNHTILNELPIIVPPIAEQRAIMQSADNMLVEIECLESIYRQKLAALEELKQSLLYHAFNGEL